MNFCLQLMREGIHIQRAILYISLYDGYLRLKISKKQLWAVSMEILGQLQQLKCLLSCVTIKSQIMAQIYFRLDTTHKGRLRILSTHTAKPTPPYSTLQALPHPYQASYTLDQPTLTPQTELSFSEQVELYYTSSQQVSSSNQSELFFAYNFIVQK